jgi:hypothetical protein
MVGASNRRAAAKTAAELALRNELNRTAPRRSTTAVGLEVRREAEVWRRRLHCDDGAAAAWVAGTVHSA